MNIPRVSVVIPTHNPHPGRFHRTLEGLAQQSLPANQWETVVVDNASSPAVDRLVFAGHAPGNVRIIAEPALGLSSARRAGLLASTAPVVVFVDDDNVLAPDYLAQTLRLVAANPRLGLICGKSLPEFETEPSPWQREFLALLALRDLGPRPQISAGLRPDGATCNCYPAFAPVGAGMAVRREACARWLEIAARLPDRRGCDLSSAGDNEIVFTALESGWDVGYFPDLVLTHLIPTARLEAGYLARLNRGIQKSWMQVLTRHQANPWCPVSGPTVPIRKLKAWFTHRAWSGPAERIRWQGACGHFEGRWQSGMM